MFICAPETHLTDVVRRRLVESHEDTWSLVGARGVACTSAHRIIFLLLNTRDG